MANGGSEESAASKGLTLTDEAIKKEYLIPTIACHVPAGTLYADVGDEVALAKQIVKAINDSLETLFPSFLFYVSVLVFKHGGTYESKAIKWEGERRDLSLLWLSGSEEGATAILLKVLVAAPPARGNAEDTLCALECCNERVGRWAMPC